MRCGLELNEGVTAMRYVEWVSMVLKTAKASENIRTRLVGLPIPGLRDRLQVTLADADAIGDAVYDLEVKKMGKGCSKEN
jgi:hypothetical protein